ncbi:hypothetical protein [Pseudomonas sp. SDO55104_S430]
MSRIAIPIEMFSRDAAFDASVPAKGIALGHGTNRDGAYSYLNSVSNACATSTSDRRNVDIHYV